MSIVLVVDDSAVDRRLVGGMLGKVPGLAVQFAADGREALAFIEAERPDLVITDLVMPELDVSRPPARALAPTSPATIAAALLPKPLPTGMRLMM